MTVRLLEHLSIFMMGPEGVANLRRFILQLAFMGKLVPQDQSDVSTLELLNDIERVKVQKGCRLKPELLLVPEDEFLYELPSSWQWARLGRLCSYIQRGKSPVYSDRGNCQVISQKCVRWTGLDLSVSRFISDESLAKYDQSRFVQKGDILWNSTGTGTIGRACLCQVEKDQLVVDSHVTLVRPILTSSEYLCRWIESPFVQTRIVEVASGSTNQIELNLSSVLAQPVPVPPLAEQHRIVAKVEELMAICDHLEAQEADKEAAHTQLVKTLLTALTQSSDAADFATGWMRIKENFDTLFTTEASVDALKQALLQLAVMGKLVARKDGEEAFNRKISPDFEYCDSRNTSKVGSSQTESVCPFLLPRGWEWIKLSDMAYIGTGSTPSRSHAEFYGGTIPWVTSGLTREKFIEDTEEKITEAAVTACRLKIYPRHSLVLAMYGQGKTRGQISELLIESTVNQACAVIVLNSDVADYRCYIKLYFEYAYDLLRSISAGGAQPNLNVEKVKQTMIPLPPLTEQARIVACVKALTEICDELGGSLRKVKAIQERAGAELFKLAITSK